ncbi:hypothetical protein DPMN_078698 [Dreissena polymorpha]|uniref:Uncharacterized protein n=1 Tax=Dreissena polymorpha TaxID=45954 RepID=A0A9D3YMR1_DREPO|nr:hypothetical protein DPMN_078698 [Dreissena polymorpha]
MDLGITQSSTFRVLILILDPCHPMKLFYHINNPLRYHSTTRTTLLQNSLQVILSTHMMVLLPDTGIQYAEPISTPILTQIKKSLCKDIWKGKYVELSSLLPVNSASQPANSTLQLDKQAHISIQPSTRSTKITSIEVWTSAFIRYVSVRTHKYPGKTQQLLKYMEIIRDLATRCPGPAFQLFSITTINFVCFELLFLCLGTEFTLNSG